MAWQYGVAQTVAVTFYSVGEPTAPTGALSATISKDGGAFASISGTVTQIGATACALLSLAIADTTCTAGVVRIVDAGGSVDDRYVEFTTEANYTATRAGYIDAAITSREASGAAAAAVVGLAATGEAAAAVGTLHDFDPTSDTVDVGAVAGAAVVGVNDFKADVSGLALTGEAAAAVGTLNDLSAADVEDAVWDATLADRDDAGSTGLALAGAGDPWGTALPGAYGDGTAGKILGTNLDAAISTRSTLTAQQVWEYGTRSLSTFGTLVADVATAVWGAVARTITGGTITTNSDKTGYALTAAYDAAKTAAAAGAKMDLVDAPNATAVTAIQNGLAATGEAATAVGTLHDFDPSAETVDVGAVAGVAVIGVDDFKADVSGLALTGEAAAAVVGLALTGEAATAVGTLNDLSAAEVENAVWDAATADHTDAGSMGVAVSGAGDPWSTVLPGLYGAGTAGKIVGDNLDAAISTRSTLTAAQVWAAGSRTLTGFGTLVADVATAVWTAVARTITGGTVTTVGDKTGYALTAAYDAAQTAAQAADLATVAADVLRTLGLAQENQHIDNVTTDIYGRMASARMRTYSAAGSVGTASDVLATYTITATYTGAEEAPTTYSVVRV